MKHIQIEPDLARIVDFINNSRMLEEHAARPRIAMERWWKKHGVPLDMEKFYKMLASAFCVSDEEARERWNSLVVPVDKKAFFKQITGSIIPFHIAVGGVDALELLVNLRPVMRFKDDQEDVPKLNIYESLVQKLQAKQKAERERAKGN